MRAGITRRSRALLTHLQGALEQPPGMRRAYLRGAAHYVATPTSLRRTLHVLAPLATSDDIRHALRAATEDEAVRQVLAERHRAPGMLADHEITLLHALVRLRRPALVVETGVASGSSSVAILSALHANGTGRLVSIDLPTVATVDAHDVRPRTIDLPNHETSAVASFDAVGWLVPEVLRSAWDLRLGDALELLPDVAPEEPVDLFLHDSLHRYEHMLAEFRIMWPRLSPGAPLLADDVFAFGHAAIAEFADEVGRPFGVLRGMGYIVRP